MSAAGGRVRRFAAAALGPLLVVAAYACVQTALRGRAGAASAAVAAAVAAAAVYWLHARYVERRRPGELAARGTPWLAAGALCGVALIGAVFVVLAAVGVYHVGGLAPFPVDLASAACITFAGALLEELVFRGYLFRWLALWNAWAAVALTSLLFGFAHAANPHATPLSSLAIAAEAGLLLAAAYWLSGNLWFPIGIHFGWNFSEGSIFSTPVSGTQSPGVIVGTLSGPGLLTGGAFGIEASLVACLMCTAAGALMLAHCVAHRLAPVR